ncbi:MAG: hypothetical protein ABI594_03070 [Ginsengibacter sp.]
MKSILLVILFSAIINQLHAQNTANAYDSVLAEKLHADSYGMKKYYLVILKTGPANITDSAKLDSIFSGHMKNIQWLASQNKMVVAGPLGKNDMQYEGIFILNTDSKTEAEKMLATDPAVQSKSLTAEYYLYYGSAALQEIPGIHDKIAKTHF